MPRPNTVFNQIVGEVRKLLVSSVPPGERIPSYRELARTYGVVPDTIQRALHLLAREKLVRIQPRVGCIRIPDSTSEKELRRRPGAPLRVGIISRLSRAEWNSELYHQLFKEAVARSIVLAEVPNTRRSRSTPARDRIDLPRIPWNSFDVGLLCEIEDALTLSQPVLRRRRVLAVDQDATSYGLESVAYNDWQAGQLAARHLFELGHRRFAISDETNDPEWPLDAAWTHRRLGFEAELGRLGGMIRPAWRMEMPRFRRGFDAVESFRGQIAAWQAASPGARPTALFSVTTWRLDVFIRELDRAGLRVPRDLSIVSVLPKGAGATVAGIRLTHAATNAAALVSRALDAAQEMAVSARSGSQPRLHSIPVLLVPGDSTAGLVR